MDQAVGYIRVSTTNQAEDGVSIEMQQSKIRSWAELHSVELLDVFVDEGISGANEERPGLLAALEVVRETKCALVAYSMSRISRSTIHMLTLAEEIQHAGGDLVTLVERIDTGSPAGRVAFRIMSALNEFEREIISERTTEAMQHMKAQGRRVGSVPYGYEADGEYLRELEREQQVIQHVRALKAEGYTLRQISDELAARGVFSRNGKPFHPQQVSRIAAA